MLMRLCSSSDWPEGCCHHGNLFHFGAAAAGVFLVSLDGHGCRVTAWSDQGPQTPPEEAELQTSSTWRSAMALRGAADPNA